MLAPLARDVSLVSLAFVGSLLSTVIGAATKSGRLLAAENVTLLDMSTGMGAIANRLVHEVGCIGL